MIAFKFAALLVEFMKVVSIEPKISISAQA
jgi:hypothetical protein